MDCANVKYIEMYIFVFLWIDDCISWWLFSLYLGGFSLCVLVAFLSVSCWLFSLYLGGFSLCVLLTSLSLFLYLLLTSLSRCLLFVSLSPSIQSCLPFLYTSFLPLFLTSNLFFLSLSLSASPSPPPPPPAWPAGCPVGHSEHRAGLRFAHPSGELPRLARPQGSSGGGHGVPA